MSNYPPPQNQPPYPPLYQPAPPTSTTAIISLIAGILGLSLFPIIASILAVITGHVAKNEIARSGGAIGGGGLATAGLVLGYIGVGLLALSLCGVGLFVGLPACLLVLGGLFSGASNPQSMLLPVLLAI